MIKAGRPPPQGIVTRIATRRAPVLGELAGMGILVTPLAARRRLLEVNILESGLLILREVATAAHYGAMRAQQGKRSGRMIEPRDFMPRPRRVAGLATRRRAIRAGLLHALGKLPIVRIGVTRGAGEVLKMVFHRRRRGLLCLGLVACVALDRDVRAGQRETCLVVLRQREFHGMKALYAVAVFTTILVRGPRELSLVHIHVTCQTFRVSDLEHRVRTFRDVTFRTCHFFVLPFERVFSGSMHRYREERWLEALHIMTLGAFAGRFALAELPVVHILMAIYTFRVWDGFLEVRILVAFLAKHGFVLPEEREICFGMVKSRDSSHLAPRRCRMARLARIRKCPVVRIAMARDAILEGNSGVLHVGLWSLYGGVAFLAGYLFMCTR